MKYRAEGRLSIYMDESCILPSHVSGKSWSDDSINGVHIPLAKGDRLIIIYAEGENGFESNTLTMWKAGKYLGNFHEQRQLCLMAKR